MNLMLALILVTGFLINHACSRSTIAGKDEASNLNDATKIAVKSDLAQPPRSVKFVELIDRYQWLIGDTRAIHKTEDGGYTWKQIYSVAPEADLRPHIMGLSFINSQTGFLIVDKRLVRTDDGGKNWEDLGIIPTGPELSFLVNCDFIDSEHGWAVGGVFMEGAVGNPNTSPHVGAVFATHDGGRSWKRQQLGLPENYYIKGTRWALKDVHFRNAETGWIVGDDIAFWTKNGGNTWHLASFNRGSYKGDFEQIRSLSDQIVWATQRESSAFAISLDAGQNWKWLKGPPQYGARRSSVVYLTPTRGLAASMHIYETTDGGYNWKPEKVVGYANTVVYEHIGRAYDGALIALGFKDEPITSLISTDNGKTWHSPN